MQPSATSTTVIGPVGERLQASTVSAPVLDHPAPLRRLRDSGAGCKFDGSKKLVFSQSRDVRNGATRIDLVALETTLAR